MKTGLGLKRRYRQLYAYLNLFRFWCKKVFIGFDVANLLLQRLDKQSLKLILRKNGATIGKNCDLDTGLVFHNCKSYKNLTIGDNSHVGKDCFFDLRSKISIGRNVTISMGCAIISHIDLGKSRLRELYPIQKLPVQIADNAYLGANSTILMGVTVGQSAFVAAGSVVTNSVSDKTMVGGVPARVIREIEI